MYGAEGAIPCNSVYKNFNNIYFLEDKKMVKIRLKRVGAKKQPIYRVVVADSRSPRNGRNIEEIGYYNPLTNPAEIKIDAEKAAKWISNGAQPTETVKALLKKAGITE